MLARPLRAVSAGTGCIAVEGDVDLVLGGARALGDVEIDRAHDREIADWLVERHGDVDLDLLGDDLLALGVADKNRERQRNIAGFALWTEQHATREAYLDADATGFDLAFAGGLGDLATVHDGEAVADAALLVDRHVAFARPDLEARTAMRHVEARPRAGTIGFCRRQQLIFVDRADIGRGFVLAAKPAAADARGKRGHAATAEDYQQRTRHDAAGEPSQCCQCRLRHDAPVRTLAWPPCGPAIPPHNGANAPRATVR